MVTWQPDESDNSLQVRLMLPWPLAASADQTFIRYFVRSGIVFSIDTKFYDWDSNKIISLIFWFLPSEFDDKNRQSYWCLWASIQSEFLTLKYTTNRDQKQIRTRWNVEFLSSNDDTIRIIDMWIERNYRDIKTKQNIYSRDPSECFNESEVSVDVYLS